MEGSEHPHILPPSPGQTPRSFHSSPPLPPPRFPSSKCFHRPQLQEEADALLRGRGAAAAGPGDWRRDPSGRLDRELPFSSAPQLLSSLAALRSRPQPPVFTVALWRHRGGGSSFSSVPPSPPSLLPSLPAAPPRRSSPSPPKSS